MRSSPAPYNPRMASTLPHETRGASHGPALARTMGLFSLVVYGVGDMVGSGIYGTVGKAAGLLGNAVWLGFLVSMVAALLTGLSYACIASRYPRAGGAAFVTHHAFAISFLSYMVGLAVTASGLTSMAASSNVFSRTLAELVGFGSVWLWIAVFLGFMTLVNFWGIRQSMWVNLLCTVIEVGGLLFVIAVGMRFWGTVNYLETPAATATSTGLAPVMLMSGAVLTFFSFVGFEDMLNVAEEVKEPRRTMPWGLVIALCIAAVLYMAVAITAVSTADWRALKDAPAPLSVITDRAAPWLPGWVYKFITMFAVANTVLINYIMGSRLLYGMARQRLLPAALQRVHPKRRTPHVAIGVLLVVVVLLLIAAGEGGVQVLAVSTGLLLLLCFMVVNGALVVLKFRPAERKGAFEVPVAIPIIGIIVNGILVAARIYEARKDPRPILIAAGVIATIVVLYLIMRPHPLTEEQLIAAELAAEEAA